MRLISKSKAFERLTELREEFRDLIESEFQPRAKPCSSCADPGACCRDEHFVNVRITRLEAEAIRAAVGRLDGDTSRRVMERAEAAIERYGLDVHSDDDRPKTYACPLFEPGAGCLVHHTAKPLPCIAHACYDDPRDLPPEHLLDEAELRLGRLNKHTYGRDEVPAAIPVALTR